MNPTTLLRFALVLLALSSSSCTTTKARETLEFVGEASDLAVGVLGDVEKLTSNPALTTK